MAESTSTLLNFSELSDNPGSQERNKEPNTYSKSRSKLRKESSIGKQLRKSLQTCKVGNNLAKLEGVLKSTTSKAESTILNGLLYVFQQLLAKSNRSNQALGFLPFEDAYGLYCGFFESCPDEVQFRDHLLHQEHGLCIIITEVYNKRFILLQSENFSLEEFLFELEGLRNEHSLAEHRFHLNAASLNSILHSMDTQYDCMALKAVIFALHSRSETYNLGIKPDRAVQFLSKVVSASDECEKAELAADHIFQSKMQERIENVTRKIQDVEWKLGKQSVLLSEKRKSDVEGEKNALEERLENLQSLERNDISACRKVQQAKRKIVTDLIDSNRIKRRKLGAGAPSLLDSEDEEFIADAIASKSTCHGRRHETTLFTNHRVKKRHFLSLAQYSLLRRGKKLIKSATTVTNRGKPRNVTSREAKSHNGKWLWCTKKLPKTEDHDTECTHHQRAHVHNAKLTMFANDQTEHSLLISMDDKAYLRPGTDVGFRDTKAGVIYDVCDPEKQRQLPQHDFNHPEVNQTPASFRFIRQHTEKIEEKDELISDEDQSVVIIRGQRRS